MNVREAIQDAAACASFSRIDASTFERELEARGYVIVPNKLTKEMLEAGLREKWFAFRYRAAIAARPRVRGG